MSDGVALSTAHFSQEDPGEVEWMEGGYGPLSVSGALRHRNKDIKT